MAYSGDELHAMLEQAARLPHGARQMAEAEYIIRHADDLGDRRLMFDARMFGSDAYTFGGEPAKAFVTFAWCLAEFDGASEVFTAWDDEQLRWQYKWIISASLDFPEIPLARVTMLLDDMARRYRMGGHSPFAVYALRWLVADFTGDTEGADQWFELWRAAPRDENASCQGCVATNWVTHLVARGRDSAAFALAESVLSGAVSCDQQPHGILTQLMVPYLRGEQYDKAVDAHLRGYRGVADQLAELADIGHHIEFCGLTGNEARGLELIERHLDWLDRAPSPLSAMEFAAGSAFVLRRLVDAARGGLTVYRRATADHPAGDVTVAALAEELTALARGTAARFDARNGTLSCTETIERRLNALPLVGFLPLSAVARAGARLAQLAPGQTSEGTPGQVRRREWLAAAMAELPRDPSVAELYQRALHAYQVLDSEPFAVAIWELLAAQPGDSSDLHQAWTREAQARVAVLRDQDHTAAEKPFREAIDAYRRCMDERAARVAETWLGRSLTRIGDSEQGTALLEGALDWLRQHGHRSAVTRAELRLAESMIAVGRFPEALAAVDRAEAEQSFDPAPTAALRTDLTRAFCLLAAGRLAEAAELTQRLVPEAQRRERPDLVGLSCACLGYAMEGIGDHVAAVEAFDDALEACDDDKLIDQVRAIRAHLIANSPRAGEAIDELVEVVARLVAAGDDLAAAAAHHDLAVAYHVAGDLVSAAETAETAVRALGAVGRQAAADRCRYRLSRIYMELGEGDQALTVLDELVCRLDGFDNLAARGQIHEDAAQILFQLDRDTAAAARFVSAEECYRAANQLHDAARVLRAGAVAASWTDDLEAGLVALERADRIIAQLPEGHEATRYEQAMLDVDAAKVLTNIDRPAQAVERLARAPGTLREIGAYAEALDAELLHARLLLSLGEAGRGETLLRSVIAGSPHDTGLHRSAVWTLIALLDETGRRLDASALRSAYDLPEYPLDDADESE